MLGIWFEVTSTLKCGLNNCSEKYCSIIQRYSIVKVVRLIFWSYFVFTKLSCRKNSEDFHNFYVSILHSFQGLWIGLNDKYLENRFLWVNGVDLSKSNFTNWLKGEPTNSFGNEDCVEVHGKLAPGKWNDNYCSSLRNYICEKKAGETYHCLLNKIANVG